MYKVNSQTFLVEPIFCKAMSSYFFCKFLLTWAKYYQKWQTLQIPYLEIFILDPLLTPGSWLCFFFFSSLPWASQFHILKFYNLFLFRKKKEQHWITGDSFHILESWHMWSAQKHCLYPTWLMWLGVSNLKYMNKIKIVKEN